MNYVVVVLCFLWGRATLTMRWWRPPHLSKHELNNLLSVGEWGGGGGGHALLDRVGATPPFSIHSKARPTSILSTSIPILLHTTSFFVKEILCKKITCYLLYITLHTMYVTYPAKARLPGRGHPLHAIAVATPSPSKVRAHSHLIHTTSQVTNVCLYV